MSNAMTTLTAPLAMVSAAATTSIADWKSVVAQVKAVQEVMKAVMKAGVHYGIIPGTGDKPSLYKPGSEVLLSAFKIAVKPKVREIRDGNHITYQIDCVGEHITSGLVIGIGLGEASTAEDKYAWRASVCDEEYDATPEDRRRVKWNKGKRGYNGKPDEPAWSVKQVRTNPADIANTVLKMAKKRAQIDLCLTGLAASDCFTQDIEDLPDELREHGEDRPPPKTKNNLYQEKSKTGQPKGDAPAGAVTEGQVKLLKAKLSAAGKTEADLLKHYSVDTIESFPKAKVNEALEWIAGKGATGG